MDVYVDQKWWKFVGSTINMAEDEIKLPLHDSCSSHTLYIVLECGASIDLGYISAN
jgi:hypothetical protein